MFNYTKGYLREKDTYVLIFYITSTIASRYFAVANKRSRNEFGIPDILNEPCLLLYSYITILALLFID